MNKREIRHRSQLAGGCGAQVVNGDLMTAIQVWKQDVKNSGVLQETFRRKEFIKNSELRKRELEAARYREQFN